MAKGNPPRPNMSWDDFWSVVNPEARSVLEVERQRLIHCYKRYEREHRRLFADFLGGKFCDEDEFWDQTLDERDKAKGKQRTRQTRASFGSTNRRKFLKLAVRVIYLRMTGGVGEDEAGHVRDSWSCPEDKPIPLHHANKALAAAFATWFGSEQKAYHAIRKTYRDAVTGEKQGYLIFQSTS